MCSILAILTDVPDRTALRERAIRLSALQRHRGPDWSGVHEDRQSILVHERLAIVDAQGGAQPLIDAETGTALAVNGEIYNHRVLRDGVGEYAYTTASDCEVILALWRTKGVDLTRELNGIFAFVLSDPSTNTVFVARDPIGVVPLYWGRDEDGMLHIASEMKALVPVCHQVAEFPPGCWWTPDQAEPVSFHRPSWASWDTLEARPPEPAVEQQRLADELDAAVRRQLMSDVPYGALLSGGLDSSIIAALAARHASRRVEDDGDSPAWWPRLHTFCIGLSGSPDLEKAAEVAAHIDSEHHGFTFTLDEGFDALEDVVRHTETYDVTTIRAATPMYLLARRIRAMGVKMVLSGEGADEVFGGYLYFHRAPDARAFHEETVRKVRRLHAYDCLRANKAMAAWGVEARVPFLDLNFLDLAMTIAPELKRPVNGRIEKHILREALGHLLPESIARRQKEQFSDGVGYGWIDALRDSAESRVSDARMAAAGTRFPINPPRTREGYWYREIFERHFPLASAAACVPGGDSVACSTPEALDWDAGLRAVTDPSGRAVRGVHTDSM